MPQDVRKIPLHTGGGKDNGKEPRVETGAVQFGDDWPGLFIRGDNAFGILLAIKRLDEDLGATIKAMGLTIEWNEIKELGRMIADDVIVVGGPPV